jgi:hypothetical protein
VAVIVITVLLVARRRARRRLVAWQGATESALTSALLARDLLPTAGRNITDAAHWQSVRDREEQAAQGLDVAAGKAPTPVTEHAATDAAQALRSVTFALEAARLLEDGASPPTAEQLAEADTTTHAGQVEMRAALERLEDLVRPAASSAAPSSSAS